MQLVLSVRLENSLEINRLKHRVVINQMASAFIFAEFVSACHMQTHRAIVVKLEVGKL